MGVNMTLKGIPEDLYIRLKTQAKANRRSLNGEAITLLEAGVEPRQRKLNEQLELIAAIHRDIQDSFSADDIATLKQAGRP